jgi:hypothetical protein
MQIVENRALVLTTDDPSLITQSIPKSVIIETGEVAVKWGLKEAQTLASLGFADVPSPIKRDYTWTGKFKPLPTKRQLRRSSPCTNAPSALTSKAQVRPHLSSGPPTTC